MEKIDFFVHPEYSLMVYSTKQQLYLDNIIDEIKTAENPILVNARVDVESPAYKKWISKYKQKCQFDDLFGEDYVLTSNSFHYQGFHPYGYVHQSQFQQLRDLIGNDSDTSFVIHGCFIGDQCLSNLAVQLLGLIGEGAHWFNWADKPQIEQTTEDDSARARVISEKYFEKVDLGYGICFTPEQIGYDGLKVSRFERNLIKPSTVVYGRS